MKGFVIGWKIFWRNMLLKNWNATSANRWFGFTTGFFVWYWVCIILNEIIGSFYD